MVLRGFDVSGSVHTAPGSSGTKVRQQNVSGENRYSDGNFRQVRGLADFVALRRSHTILTTTRRATAASRKRPQSRKLRWIQSPTRTRPCSCCRACGARTRSPRSARRSPRERESGPLIIPCYHTVVAPSMRWRRRLRPKTPSTRRPGWLNTLATELLLPVHALDERAVDVGPPLVQQLHRISDLRHPR